MEAIEVDDIAEVTYLDDANPEESQGVRIRYKNGEVKTYGGADLPEVLAALNHWTPPTA